MKNTIRFSWVADEIVDGGAVFKAFVWTEQTGTRSLKQLLEEEYGLDLTGWILQAVSGISFDGRVLVGCGFNPAGEREFWRAELPPWPVANAPEVPQSSEWSVSVFPNPVRERATVRVTLPAAGHARIDVLDVLGRVVAVLHEGPLAVGAHSFSLSTELLPAGVYVVRADFGKAGAANQAVPCCGNRDQFSSSGVPYCMYFRTADPFTTTNDTLQSGGRLHLRAREAITITGDFLAEAGGEFLAKIESAPGGGGASARMGEEVVEPPFVALPRLEPNYPNPVRQWTTFRFTIPEEARVTLKIYDVLGREVMTLFDADHEAGNVTLRWNPSNQLGRSLSSGVYLYRLKVGNHVETRTLTVLK